MRELFTENVACCPFQSVHDLPWGKFRPERSKKMNVVRPNNKFNNISR